jgi:ATP-binding cassette subfamily F protein 1
MNISIQKFDLKVPGKTLLHDTTIKLSESCKYGLVGLNGSGKTTLLKALIGLQPFQEGNTLLVEQELPNEDASVYDYVWSSNTELAECVEKFENLDEDADDYIEMYEGLQTELDGLEYQKQKSIISKILKGLGFNAQSQTKKITHFSGGWRMRIALAKALYIQPDILFLDEPSNHLDINATVWLTDYLRGIRSTVVIVSHNQNLLNCVCDWIMFLDTHTKQIVYFKGNYGQFEQMRNQMLEKQNKDWEKLTKRVKQLKTKKEREEAMKKSDVEKPPRPYIPKISFRTFTQLRSQNPLLLNEVGLRYPGCDENTLSDVSISVDTETRITIVGDNGSGKSTLMKILSGDLECTEGEVFRDPRLRIGFYHQNSSESLDNECTPIECILSANSEVKLFEARKMLGSIGLDGKLHTTPISQLSGGQKARVAFCVVISVSPHLLLLDEPTNHLDIETVNALIEGINTYEGGVVMVTHDEKLVTDTECVLWVCEDGTVEQFDGDYEDYKFKILEE